MQLISASSYRRFQPQYVNRKTHSSPLVNDPIGIIILRLDQLAVGRAVAFVPVGAVPGDARAQQFPGCLRQATRIRRLVPFPLNPLFRLAEQFLPPRSSVISEAIVIPVGLQNAGVDKLLIARPVLFPDFHGPFFDTKPEQRDGRFGQGNGLHGILLAAS